MTNEEALNLICRNRSVFQYDPDMLQALAVAMGAIKRDKAVDDIVVHWNDKNSSFVSACMAFEEILKIYGVTYEQ